MEDPIAVLAASPFRRALACATLAGLGLLLIRSAVGLSAEQPLVGVVLMGLGAVMVWQAVTLWRVTGRALVLTREGLFEDGGPARELARWDDIARVDRGAFALKPSNGFVIHLKSPAGGAWVPGLWWRYGRRVGVGGTASGAAAKALADQMTVILNDLATRQSLGIVLPGDTASDRD